MCPGASPHVAFGWFWGQVWPTKSAKTRSESKVVCAAISGGLCTIHPKAFIADLARCKRKANVLQIRQPCVQCPPEGPSLLTCLQWVDVLQRPGAACTQCPKAQRKRL